jgi:uncharacterized protein YkwD
VGIDRTGAFTVQVVATTSDGPRPVAEALVFADVEPRAIDAEGSSDPAPPVGPCGEPTRDGRPNDDSRDDEQELARKIAAARTEAGEPPLLRDPRLDALAREHARRMAAIQTAAHDAGDGDPAERARAAGIIARTLGENVAHAVSVADAHRALWASPSHRANLMRRDFDRLGIGVFRDDTGHVWVVEAFASTP